MKGHVAPGATVARVRPQDAQLVLEAGPGVRLSRCLRCDNWARGADPLPAQITSEHLPPLAELPRPMRGKALNELVVVRLIAIDRWIHVVFFLLLALLLVAVTIGLPVIRETAQQLLDGWQLAVQEARPSSGFLARILADVAHLDRSHIGWLIAVALGYAALEGVEAFYLWRGRRWAEYLTVLATGLLLPFVVSELIDKVTIPRILGLVADLAILAYLIVAKRLFGVRGGDKALQADLAADVDWSALHSQAPLAGPGQLGEVTAEKPASA